MAESRSAVQLTAMLKAWRSGDHSALEELAPMIYEELYRLARVRMIGENSGHVLQPTALVNEAFIRLMSGSQGEWRDRVHFFSFASRLMRHILVDFARSQGARKRGQRATTFITGAVHDVAPESDFYRFVDLDKALAELAEIDERKARVVELRYFGGLENAEVAEILSISEDTVTRDWRTARTWLFDRLKSE